MVLNIWVKHMNKNTNKLEKIIIILLFTIIIAIGAYFNIGEENQTNHVLYRVTPYFKGNNELASGVNIEAYSVEDNGELRFNVYVYNAQGGIDIDYATGESKLAE